MLETQEFTVGQIPEANSFPAVEYDKSLEDAPYEVSVDKKKLAAFLKHFEMNDKDIKGLKLHVTRELPTSISLYGVSKPLGHYTPDNRIELGFDPLWGFYQDHLKLMRDVIEKRKTLGRDEFKGFLRSKKWPQYLAEAPPERSWQFANRMLFKALAREQNSILHHEIGHALDPQTKRRGVLANAIIYTAAALGIAGQIGIVVGLSGGAEYEFMGKASVVTTTFALAILSPIAAGTLIKSRIGEAKASQFAQSIGHNPDWQSIITINPRGEISTNSRP